MNPKNIATCFLNLAEERFALGKIGIEYDVFITLASWESRCFAISQNLELKTKELSIFHFSPSHGPKEIVEENIKKIIKGFGGRAEKTNQVKLRKSTDYAESQKLIIDYIDEISKKFLLLRVGIDISSIPIGYLQVILGYLIQSRKSALIDCYYVEPEYEVEAVKTSSSSFTGGGWTLVKVPYLEGKHEGVTQSCGIICVGGETDFVRELLSSKEYHETSIVKPTNGSLANWEVEIIRDCEELATRFHGIRDGFEQLNAYSAVDVVAHYCHGVQRSWSKMRREFISIGTKPHGIAGVICAFSDPGLSVLARVPILYNPTEVRAGNHFWIYKIRDMSSTAWANIDFPDWN